MKIKVMRKVKSNQQGVVLLEALIGMLIFSLGILGMVGLQASMIRNTGEAKSRAEASYLAQQTIGQMWADPSNLATYVKTDNIATLPNGVRTVTALLANQYQITIGWTAPGDTISTSGGDCQTMGVAHCFTTVATIAGN
jgi:type IV pilus assembly protein PilV